MEDYIEMPIESAFSQPLLSVPTPLESVFGDMRGMVSKGLEEIATRMQEEMGRMFSAFTRDILRHFPRGDSFGARINVPSTSLPKEGGRRRPILEEKTGAEKGKGRKSGNVVTKDQKGPLAETLVSKEIPITRAKIDKQPKAKTKPITTQADGPASQETRKDIAATDITYSSVVKEGSKAKKKNKAAKEGKGEQKNIPLPLRPRRRSRGEEPQRQPPSC